jgi:hypothetical protein
MKELTNTSLRVRCFEHPILFSTPMVQAILEGRKTMTRRIINEAPIDFEYDGYGCRVKDSSVLEKLPIIEQRFIKAGEKTKWVKCKYGERGDLLWVRESFSKIDHPEFKIRFKADHLNPKSVKWSPSIHMPKSAARIWLQITNIKVERLQNISEKDTINEGIRIPVNEGKPVFILGNDNSALSFLPDGCFANNTPPLTQMQYLFAFFAELWCKINGRESWDANPWVWVVEFKVISTPDSHRDGKPAGL